MPPTDSCLLQATTREGNPDEAWHNIGLIRHSQLRLEEAESAFQHALVIDPDYRIAAIVPKEVQVSLVL